MHHVGWRVLVAVGTCAVSALATAGNHQSSPSAMRMQEAWLLRSHAEVTTEVRPLYGLVSGTTSTTTRDLVFRLEAERRSDGFLDLALRIESGESREVEGKSRVRYFLPEKTKGLVVATGVWDPRRRVLVEAHPRLAEGTIPFLSPQEAEKHLRSLELGRDHRDSTDMQGIGTVELVYDYQPDEIPEGLSEFSREATVTILIDERPAGKGTVERRVQLGPDCGFYGRNEGTTHLEFSVRSMVVEMSSTIRQELVPTDGSAGAGALAPAPPE